MSSGPPAVSASLIFNWHSPEAFLSSTPELSHALLASEAVQRQALMADSFLRSHLDGHPLFPLFGLKEAKVIETRN